MNDFTQDELVMILHWGLDRIQAVGIKYFTEEGNMKLFHKLQDMIVNYCEHESAKSINPGDTVLICNKCETILSHWNLRKFNYD